MDEYENSHNFWDLWILWLDSDSVRFRFEINTKTLIHWMQTNETKEFRENTPNFPNNFAFKHTQLNKISDLKFTKMKFFDKKKTQPDNIYAQCTRINENQMGAFEWKLKKNTIDRC